MVFFPSSLELVSELPRNKEWAHHLLFVIAPILVHTKYTLNLSFYWVKAPWLTKWNNKKKRSLIPGALLVKNNNNKKSTVPQSNPAAVLITMFVYLFIYFLKDDTCQMEFSQSHYCSVFSQPCTTAQQAADVFSPTTNVKRQLVSGCWWWSRPPREHSDLSSWPAMLPLVTSRRCRCHRNVRVVIHLVELCSLTVCAALWCGWGMRPMNT